MERVQGLPDDTKKSGPEDRTFPCLPGWNWTNGISGAASRDAPGWLSGRSMWGEIALFFRRFFCRSCRRRGGGRAGLRSSIPCSVLMIPGKLDEGIEAGADLTPKVLHCIELLSHPVHRLSSFPVFFSAIIA